MKVVNCPLHQSGVAVAGTTNAVNTRQSEAVTVSLFFAPHQAQAFNRITPPHGHFVLSPVSLASRDQDGTSRTQRSTSTISQKNRRLWTVYQTLLERHFSWNENLQRKQNWIAKSRNLKENAGKIATVFFYQSRLVSWKAWTWILPWILQELKKYAWKTCGCAQHVEVIQSESEFWMKGALGTVEICVLCGWRF